MGVLRGEGEEGGSGGDEGSGERGGKGGEGMEGRGGSYRRKAIVFLHLTVIPPNRSCTQWWVHLCDGDGEGGEKGKRE